VNGNSTQVRFSHATSSSQFTVRLRTDRIFLRTFSYFVRMLGMRDLARVGSQSQQQYGDAMQTLLQNLRFSMRMLRKNPGLTITVLLTLALGIGGNAAIFPVDYATLLAPLPYPHPEQIVMVWSKIKTYHNGVSAGDFTDWKRQATVFSDLDAWTGAAFNIATKDQPEYMQGTRATTGWFRVMANPIQFGRGFLPEEGVAGHEHVVVLNNKLWKRLGSDPNMIDKKMQLDGEPYTVVGVMATGPPDKGMSAHPESPTSKYRRISSSHEIVGWRLRLLRRPFALSKNASG
jgi:MacB-like periplasmic core domain